MEILPILIEWIFNKKLIQFVIQQFGYPVALRYSNMLFRSMYFVTNITQNCHFKWCFLWTQFKNREKWEGQHSKEFPNTLIYITHVCLHLSQSYCRSVRKTENLLKSCYYLFNSLPFIFYNWGVFHKLRHQ